MTWGLFQVVGMRMAAIFMLITSMLGRRAGVLPGWLVALGIVFALVLLATVTISEPLGFLFPAWVTIVSVTLLVHRRQVRAGNA